MNKDHLNPFVLATTSTFNQFLPDCSVRRGELDLTTPPFSSSGVSVLIGISGDLEGRVVYDLSESTARDVAGGMNQTTFDEFNEMAESTIQELANIISGNAAQKLDGWNVSITPPSLITGTDTQIDDPASRYLEVPLETDYGSVTINLSIQENG